jgi:cell division protein FtsW
MDVSIYRLRTRDVLTLCVLSLLLLGVIMVQSASMHVYQDNSSGTTKIETRKWSWTDQGAKQLFFAALSIITFGVVGRIDYTGLLRGTKTVWRNPIIWCFAIAGFMCLAVLVPHIGIEKNGARRWLSLGICQVQPSELAKWAVVLFLSWWLSSRPVDLNRFSRFIMTLVPIAGIALLVVIQDFGTAALIMLCAIVMLMVGRVKWWHLAVIIPPALGAAFWFVAHKEYRWRRMTAFMNPYANPKEGYHIIQSLLSFATGGLTGKGLGNGVQKLGYLPEDTTDFIFAVICEELGLFGALLTAALYLGIIYVAWQTMKQKRDSFGRMLAFGVATMVCLQAAINMAVATVSVPTKGLSLPLVSAGGSGLVITCAALGLLYSVSRFEHEEEALSETPPTPSRPLRKRLLPTVVTEKIWNQWTTQA